MAPTSRILTPHRHSRGYVPHDDWPGAKQFITFRLADRLPVEFVRRMNWRRDDATTAERHQRIREFEAELDACRGDCVLHDPRAANIVAESIKHFDRIRYELIAWVVMPNHVHAVIKLDLDWTLTQVLHSWKWHSAMAVNRALGRAGPLWQPEYVDRRIRDLEHLGKCVRYVENNPVKAGLCQDPKDWPFSSATRLV